ncbi:MAG TPA: ANTAR domain-containing protein [Pseudonocardiaceae bacterium]|nr:ANTAR domain-containing protein [Pseudonocardiaceae bacterium]
MDNREVWLASTLIDLTDTVAEGFDPIDYADRVVGYVAELLPFGEIGLLTTEGLAGPGVAAVTGEQMLRLLTTEISHGSGPNLDCFRVGERLLNQPVPLATIRWPEFADAARVAGFGLVSALPVCRRGIMLGALAIGHGKTLSDRDVTLTATVADAAAVGLLQQRALHRSHRMAEQLQRALTSRVVIEQAKGMIAAALGLSVEAAFELLRGYAREYRRRLADVADEVIARKLPAGNLAAGNRSKTKN